MDDILNKAYFEQNYRINCPDQLPILALGNHKGGVGKSTLSMCIAAVAGYLGLKVLLIDLDSQRNTTESMLGDPSFLNKNYWDVMDFVLRPDVSLDNAVIETKVPNVFLLPSSPYIEDKFIGSPQLRNHPIPSLAFRSKLKTLQDHVDLVVIDTAPSANIITDNAYGCATHYLYLHGGCALSERGIVTTEERINSIIRHEHVNPGLKSLGVLCNKMRTGTSTYDLAKQTTDLNGIPFLPFIVPNRAMIENRTFDDYTDKFWLRDIFSTNASVRDVEKVMYEIALHILSEMKLLAKEDK